MFGIIKDGLFWCSLLFYGIGGVIALAAYSPTIAALVSAIIHSSLQSTVVGALILTGGAVGVSMLAFKRAPLLRGTAFFVGCFLLFAGWVVYAGPYLLTMRLGAIGALYLYATLVGVAGLNICALSVVFPERMSPRRRPSTQELLASK